MTSTLPGADIRGYYAALGITLARWARSEASARCWADPDAHNRGDRRPSVSVNLDENGAWHCHGCGAKGGAYDAATALGYSRRAAMDLLIRYGLAERRPAADGHARTGPRDPGRSSGHRTASVRRALRVTEAEIRGWRRALDQDALLRARLARERGWTPGAIAMLELGLDARGRITIPVRDPQRVLVGLLRYDPWPAPGHNKLRADTGSRRQLLPHPAALPQKRSVLLCEGEPDMIAARSRGLAAIAVPGVDAWRPEWAQLLAGRHVLIVMDADRQGRDAGARIAHDLAPVAEAVLLDLAPQRTDGYDLTDWLREHPDARTLDALRDATRARA